MGLIQQSILCNKVLKHVLEVTHVLNMDGLMHMLSCFAELRPIKDSSLPEHFYIDLCKYRELELFSYNKFINSFIPAILQNSSGCSRYLYDIIGTPDKTENKTLP